MPTCRVCESNLVRPILDLGILPLSRALVQHPEDTEVRYPLDLGFCPGCSLVQLLHAIPPSLLFCHEHAYHSSVSSTLVAAAKEQAEVLYKSRKLNRDSLVIEFGSNDGYLLEHFVKQGIPVLGIEPAEVLASVAIKKGIPTRTEFFSLQMAEKMVSNGIKADLVLANNTLAHVEDTVGTVAGVAKLLKPTGLAVIEVPYVVALIEHCEFDTITHEHQCYFSLTALQKLFSRNGLAIQHVEQTSMHGGSLRIYADSKFSQYVDIIGGHPSSVAELLMNEDEHGVTALPYYEDFSIEVERLKLRLLAFLRRMKADGKKIAAYGAAAKGATLLNYCGIGQELIDFVVDKSPSKHGWYMPGSHIPIHSPACLLEDKPDFVLMLTWNFKNEILQQQEAYRRCGGKFIIPIPELEIV